MLDTTKPLILLLGDVDSEGVTSKLAAIGKQYKKKLLRSSVNNWELILKDFDNFSVREIIGKLNNRTYELIASDQYNNVVDRLFQKIAKFPHIIFVHECLLSGNNEAPNYFFIDEEIRLYVNQKLDKSNLNIIPYKRNAELTTIALTFIDQNEKNLLFRVYVPSDRMWSFESDKLLQLFRDYLSRISGLNVRLDQYRTERGTIFELYGDETTRSADISQEFEEFSNFLDLCLSNPDRAEIILQNKNLNSKAVQDIIARYFKETKRLVIDLKHEREIKLLQVRHRLESELTEVVPSDFEWSAINIIVDALIPRLDGVSSALGFYNSPSRLSSSSNLTVNINPQIINTVTGIVAQEIVGNQYINEDAKKLLELIQRHGGDKYAELTSAVYELTDKSAPQPGRLTAKQKLKKFLLNISDYKNDTSMGTLQAYLESELEL